MFMKRLKMQIMVALNHRRCWPEITIEILRGTLRPSNKMRIMYGAKLTPNSLKIYFHDLLKKGFIEKMKNSDRGVKYKITGQGRTLLEVLRKAEVLFFSEE
jgi:predicted transcriptional regulator